MSRFTRLLFLLPLLATLPVFFCAETSSGQNSTDQAEEPSVVTTAEGKLRGKIEKSRNGKDFFKFSGVTYGKVPARFHISEPVDNWDGVKNAMMDPPACLQQAVLLSPEKTKGVEDCLTLDIYTPKLVKSAGTGMDTDSKPLPVMFFIHGGGFQSGDSATYEGSYFMDQQDVVLVVVQYRLGVYGLLNARIKGASGNQGLKDIVLALKWVKRNIKYFGGDSDRVTVFGESSGSWVVSYLVMSPMAKGLFHGGIGQSGSVFSPFNALALSSLDEARKLSNLVDCPASNPEYMVECLRRIDPQLLTKLVTIPTSFLTLESPVSNPQFWPTVETYRAVDNDTNIFLPDHPYKLLAEGKLNKVPLILGMNSDEGMFGLGHLTNKILLKKINSEWNLVAPWVFLYYKSVKYPYAVSSQIKEFYFRNGEITADNETAYTNLFEDRFMIHGVRAMSLMFAKHIPVYMYNFTYKGPPNQFNIYVSKNATGWPASHGDELQYLFKVSLGYSEITPGSPHEQFSQNFMKLWTSFAKTGKPTEFWGNTFTEWTSTDSKSSPKWLQIDKNLTLEAEAPDFLERMEFWDNIPMKEFGKFE